jgi:hypothetical protein
MTLDAVKGINLIKWSNEAQKSLLEEKISLFLQILQTFK